MSVNYQEQGARHQGPLKTTPFHKWAAADIVWTLFFRLPTGYLLRFPDLADFEVSTDGRHVRGWPAPGVSPSTVEHLHLNQVLPLALSRQGKLMLHGSAVDAQGHGAAFLGASGQGKSTLAASFATSGGRFLTDDGLQLGWVGDRCQIVPSHPSIRLWPDSQEALARRATAAPSLDFTSKARLLAGAEIGFCSQPLPLRRIYFLGDGTAETVTIRPMKPAVTLLSLVRNSFLLDFDEQQILALHFDELARLANLSIHYHLDYPRRFEDLVGVREAIQRHVIDEERANQWT